jgi:hypothetical protein
MPKLLRGAALVFVLASGAFVVTYFGRWNDKLSEAFAAGFGPALRASIARAGEKDGIVVTGHVNMPYISTLFFSETPVREYLDTVVIPNRTAAFQTPTSFGRFVFGVSPEALVRDRYFVVHKSEKHLFDPALYGSESFGSFASVWKK